MYKILRKFKTRINNNELANWPVDLQKRVLAVIRKMQGYYIKEPTSIHYDGKWLHLELRGEEGWFTVHEASGSGSFEPLSDNTRKIFRAFYTP
jgi:hypothetical protein